MWKNTGGSASMCSLNSCERIRPERARNPIQRLVWGPGTQFQISGYSGLSEEELSCNPRVALRRLLRLYEGRQYREAASFLLKLPCYTFKAALPDIPIDLIVESLPHSLSLLEAVYARLLELARSNDAKIDDSLLARIEHQVIWRIVHHISMTENLRDASAWTKLLGTLSRLSPASKKLLSSRRRSLERAVEGLGKHGLVPSNDNFDEKTRARFPTIGNRSRGKIFGNSSLGMGTTVGTNGCGNGNAGSSVEPPTALVPLTAKLRDELEVRLEAYKLALHKIESWGKQNGGGGVGVGGVGVVSVGGTRSRAGDRQVRAASHQRQLSLKYSEVQQRLIDNQSLLNILEKPSDRNLEDLIGELRRRIERDKEALRQWNAVKKSSGLNNGNGTLASNKNSALAASLLQFSRACSLALRLMNDSTDPGYEEHRRGTKELENFREDGFEAAESSSSAGYHTDDSCSPTPEPVVVTVNNTPGELLEHAEASSRWTIEQLTDRYVALYAHAHLHTLDALDALESLKDATDLKAKILFSVVVLSWRVAEIVQTSRRREAWKTLSGCGADFGSRNVPTIVPTPNSNVDDSPTIRNPNGTENRTDDDCPKLSGELNECMIRQLARFGCETGTRQVAERVLNQLERTLYDFPRLKDCAELKRYALLSSSLAWMCLARTNPLILDVAHGLAEFDREIHARHHASSDPHGKRIVAVIWPGLLLRENSRTSCLYRAVVLT